MSDAAIDHVTPDSSRLEHPSSPTDAENHSTYAQHEANAIRGIKLPLLLVALCLASCILGLVRLLMPKRQHLTIMS